MTAYTYLHTTHTHTHTQQMFEGKGHAEDVDGVDFFLCRLVQLCKFLLPTLRYFSFVVHRTQVSESVRRSPTHWHAFLLRKFPTDRIVNRLTDIHPKWNLPIAFTIPLAMLSHVDERTNGRTKRKVPIIELETNINLITQRRRRRRHCTKWKDTLHAKHSEYDIRIRFEIFAYSMRFRVRTVVSVCVGICFEYTDARVNEILE